MKKKEPIRILQCVSNMDRAGIETMLMNFYRNIDREKVQFDFLCNKSKSGDYDEEIKKLGGNIYISPGLNPFKWFKYQRFMKTLFKNHPEYKIIHCQNEAMGFPALYAAKKNGIPVRIAHSHNTIIRYDFKWLIKIIYKKLLKFVATDFVACGIDAGKYLFGTEVKIIHNAIDSDKFKYSEIKRNELRNKYNLDGKFVIGHVGRFEPQKNHSFLIDVFLEYSKINKNAVLVLVGTGSLIVQIEKKVIDNNLEDKVIFMGNIDNVNEIYNIMDIFVLPSFHEGLPVVGIEAQYSGLKCLFSNKITKECDISKNSIFLELSVEKWVNEINRYYSIGHKRDSSINSIKNIDYDIKEETRKLKLYYEKLNERTQ